MKKFLLLGAVVALSAQSTFAQTVDEQKFWDGWYIGANVNNENLDLQSFEKH